MPIPNSTLETFIWSIMWKILDVVFSRFRGFSLTITLRQKPKKLRAVCVEQILALHFSYTQHAHNSFGRLLWGYCTRKHLNLEKSTSSVLSVIVINLWRNHYWNHFSKLSTIKSIFIKRPPPPQSLFRVKSIFIKRRPPPPRTAWLGLSF